MKRNNFRNTNKMKRNSFGNSADKLNNNNNNKKADSACLSEYMPLTGCCESLNIFL